MRRAFSLVELSIVLVILGLLTGGILAGQSLIRAAELRAATTEYARYTTAFHAFRDKYFAFPGDITNATSIWGKSTNCGGAATSGTCDGNGDNTVRGAGSANATGESFQFWNQLALAGLIEGNYPGTAGPNTGAEMVVGSNIPSSKLNKAGWGVTYFDNSAGGASSMWAINNNNMFIFGATVASNWNGGLVLKPEELWNIDTKLDDGKPSTGKVISYGYTTCTTGANNADFTASYNFTSTSQSCAAIFSRVF